MNRSGESEQPPASRSGSMSYSSGGGTGGGSTWLPPSGATLMNGNVPAGYTFGQNAASGTSGKRSGTILSRNVDPDRLYVILRRSAALTAL